MSQGAVGSDCLLQDDAFCAATVWMWRVAPIVLTVLGVFGNIFNIVILLRKNLRSKPCFILLFLSVSDTLCVFSVFLVDCLRIGYGVQLPHSLCLLNHFLKYAFATVSLWTVSVFTIERLSFVVFPHQSNKHLTQSMTIKVMFVVLFVTCTIFGLVFLSQIQTGQDIGMTNTTNERNSTVTHLDNTSKDEMYTQNTSTLMTTLHGNHESNKLAEIPKLAVTDDKNEAFTTNSNREKFEGVDNLANSTSLITLGGRGTTPTNSKKEGLATLNLSEALGVRSTLSLLGLLSDGKVNIENDTTGVSFPIHMTQTNLPPSSPKTSASTSSLIENITKLEQAVATQAGNQFLTSRSHLKSCFDFKFKDGSFQHMLRGSAVIFCIFLPFVIITVGNIGLAYSLYKRKPHSDSTESQTTTLFAISGILLTTLIPYGVISMLNIIFKERVNLTSSYIGLIAAIAECFTMCSFTLNFYCYFWKSTLFKEECKSVWREVKMVLCTQR